MRRLSWLRKTVLLLTIAALASQIVWSQARRQPGARGPRFPSESEPASPPAPPSVNRKMLRASYEQLQKDVDRLAELANSLKEEITKSNEDIMPVSSLQKAEEIEKLAKKVQGRIKNL